MFHSYALFQNLTLFQHPTLFHNPTVFQNNSLFHNTALFQNPFFFPGSTDVANAANANPADGVLFLSCVLVVSELRCQCGLLSGGWAPHTLTTARALRGALSNSACRGLGLQESHTAAPSALLSATGNTPRLLDRAQVWRPKTALRWLFLNGDKVERKYATFTDAQ